MTGFYSYLWSRADGTPYYAGKGTGKRAFISNGHCIHRPKERARILVFPMINEVEAFESEMALIDLFGRTDIGTGCLRNLTDGGENPPSWRGKKRGPQSEDHRRRNSEGHKGINLGHPNYARQVQLGNQYAKGVKHTAEWKAIRSAQQKEWWANKRVTISSL